MKTMYLLRVIIISFELLILLGMWLALSQFLDAATVLAQALNVNQEILKYIILLPIGIYAWVIKEAKELIFSDKDIFKDLINWSGYWKMKIHVYVSLLYGLIFCFISFIPWLSKDGITNGRGLILFLSSLCGCIWVAGSIYFAQMTVREIFHADSYD